MENHCRYFVQRKKRLCRMTVRAGEVYCGEHLIHMKPEDSSDNKKDSSTVENSKLRIPCPLDPKHTCFANKLAKHLQVCNARQINLPSYIVKNVNVSDNTEEDQIENKNNTEKRTLSEVPDNVLADVVAIIEKLYRELLDGKILKFDSSEYHPCVKEEISNELRADSSKRHLIQTSSLLNIVENNNFLSENTCFVELGAGKGQVSYYLATSTSKVPNCSVLLIDRASHRHKQDNKLDKESHSVARVRADISDLVLAEVPIIKTADKVVGVSKHLCGAATDLALRCLTKPDLLIKTQGLVMATCCHHRCSWSSYVGRCFLKEYNISRSQFDIICGLVSWATCGSGLSREKKEQIKLANAKDPKKAKYDLNTIDSDSDDEEINDKNEIDIKNNDESQENVNNNVINDGNQSQTTENVILFKRKRLGLSVQQRADIGFKAKALLDLGRVSYLEKNSFKATLYFYVDKCISPENVCIVAQKI